MPRPFQPATDHPFVEAFEPAQTAATLQIDELRMDDLFDRRIPAETDVAHLDLRHAHPARRNHDETQASVVDADHVNAFLLASSQSVFLHRPRSGEFVVEVMM